MKISFMSKIIFVLAITFLLSWYIILWTTYISSPGLLNESDFRAFYAAGKIANENEMSQVYRPDLEEQAQEVITGAPMPRTDLLTFNHPPHLLPILSFIANYSYQKAYLFYCINLILLSIISLLFLQKTLQSKYWSIYWIWLTLIATFLFEPLFISILKGQDSALLLLGMVIWFTGLIKNDDRQAGFGLALTTIRPQISIFMAIPFLFKKRKVFQWYLLGASLLVIYSYLLVGKEGFLDFIALLKLSSGGQDYGLNLHAMVNFTGLIFRTFPKIDLLLINYIKWILFGLTLLILIHTWKRSSIIDVKHLVLLVITCLVASPHLHYHDLATLVVPLIGMLLIWVDEDVIPIKTFPVIILIISIIFLFGNIVSPLFHILPYFIMFFILTGAWFPEKFKHLSGVFSGEKK